MTGNVTPAVMNQIFVRNCSGIKMRECADVHSPPPAPFTKLLDEFLNLSRSSRFLAAKLVAGESNNGKLIPKFLL